MSNSCQLAFTERGEGLPIVLLHGFPLDRTIWQSQQEKLKDRYRVIAPDLRGHGESAVPEGAWTMEQMADDVIELLDRLKIESAVVMGHSMGGYVALALTAIAPDRSALGLINTQAAADDAEAREKRRQLADKVGVAGAKAVADAMLPKLFAGNLPADDPKRRHVRSMIQHTRPESLQACLNAIANRRDHTDRLVKISVPTLVITGDADEVIVPAKSEAMAKALPNGRLIKIAGAGHLPMLEMPDETTLAIRAFLKDLPG